MLRILFLLLALCLFPGFTFASFHIHTSFTSPGDLVATSEGVFDQSKITTVYEMLSRFGVGVEYNETLSDTWAVVLGLAMDSPQTLERAAVTNSSQGSISYENIQGSFAPGVFYANAVMTLSDQQHVFFGLNFSVPIWEQGQFLTGPIAMNGGLGYQVGIGQDLGETTSLEASYQVLHFQSLHRFVVFQDTVLDTFRVAIKHRFF